MITTESVTRTYGAFTAVDDVSFIAQPARIVAGRVEHFVHETALLEQVSVVDPGRTVNDLLFGTGVHITGFVRLEVGSGRR